jgi:DNA-directed RNA polymerase specialized sigma24 family protein
MGVAPRSPWFDDCVQEYLLGGPNNVLDLLRKERRHARRIDRAVDPASCATAESPPAPPADAAWWAGVRDALTPRQWAAVEMCVIGSYSYRDAARACACSRNDIGYAIASAKRVLVSHFGKD